MKLLKNKMNNAKSNDVVKCRHCEAVRNISEQACCSKCGGRELWQSKPETQKNALENIFGKMMSWCGESMVRTFLIIFIGVPLVLALVLKLLGLVMGFEIEFHG